MKFVKLIITFALTFFVITGCVVLSNKTTDTQTNHDIKEIEYGRKLVLIMGCNDCHTAGAISGVYGPDENWLMGDDLGFNGPYGTMYPANLRLLINETTEDEWVALAQKMRQDSPMAWSRLPRLNTDDLLAIYRFIEYLGPKGVPAPRSLPPGVEPETKYFYFPLPH